MKLQDILFVLILISLFAFLRVPKLFILVGLICFVLAIPFFVFQIFFTGQRLGMYGVAFIFVGILLMVFQKSKQKYS